MSGRLVPFVLVALRTTAGMVAARVQVDGADCEIGDPVDGTLAGWAAVTYSLAWTGDVPDVTATVAWPGVPADGLLVVLTAVADDEDRWHVQHALDTLTIAEGAIADLPVPEDG